MDWCGGKLSCVCACVYVHVYICLHARVRICVSAHVWVSMRVSVHDGCACLHVCTYRYMCVRRNLSAFWLLFKVIVIPSNFVFALLLIYIVLSMWKSGYFSLSIVSRAWSELIRQENT